jgi:hypothetical protein
VVDNQASFKFDQVTKMYMDQLDQLKRDVENCRKSEKKTNKLREYKEEGMWNEF